MYAEFQLHGPSSFGEEAVYTRRTTHVARRTTDDGQPGHDISSAGLCPDELKSDWGTILTSAEAQTRNPTG